MKMEQTEYFETSAYKIQTPGNYAEESIQQSEQGESLKSRRHPVVFNTLNVQLNPICHLLALLGTHPILHVSKMRVKVH